LETLDQLTGEHLIRIARVSAQMAEDYADYGRAMEYAVNTGDGNAITIAAAHRDKAHAGLKLLVEYLFNWFEEEGIYEHPVLTRVVEADNAYGVYITTYAKFVAGNLDVGARVEDTVCGVHFFEPTRKAEDALEEAASNLSDEFIKYLEERLPITDTCPDCGESHDDEEPVDPTALPPLGTDVKGLMN
jgi:hypothetical protein